jgi:hypothetical protein
MMHGSRRLRLVGFHQIHNKGGASCLHGRATQNSLPVMTCMEINNTYQWTGTEAIAMKRIEVRSSFERIILLVCLVPVGVLTN